MSCPVQYGIAPVHFCPVLFQAPGNLVQLIRYFRAGCPRSLIFGGVKLADDRLPAGFERMHIRNLILTKCDAERAKIH